MLLHAIRTQVLSAAVVIALVASAPACAAFYMRIETIRGESMDPRHLGWIELQSFKRSRDEIAITKALDKSSVDLETAFVSGSHLGSAMIDETCPNGASHMTTTLIDPVVSKFSTVTAGGGPLDAMTLKYRTISVVAGKPCVGPIPQTPRAA